MPHGSVLRIEPVRAIRDNTTFQCVANNGVGDVSEATATLTVYPEGSGEHIMFYLLCNIKGGPKVILLVCFSKGSGEYLKILEEI